MPYDQDRFYYYTCRHSKLVYAAAEKIRDCDKTNTITTTTRTVTTITYKMSTKTSTFDDLNKFYNNEIRILDTENKIMETTSYEKGMKIKSVLDKEKMIKNEFKKEIIISLNKERILSYFTASDEIP